MSSALFDVISVKAVDLPTSFPGSLSTASPFFGRRTPVAAGRVTTQNQGGKKSVGRGEWQTFLIVAVTDFVCLKTFSSR